MIACKKASSVESPCEECQEQVLLCQHQHHILHRADHQDTQYRLNETNDEKAQGRGRSFKKFRPRKSPSNGLLASCLLLLAISAPPSHWQLALPPILGAIHI